MDYSLNRGSSNSFGPLANKNKRSKCYITLLVITKILQSLAIFYCYDVLKFVNFLQFLFIVKLCSVVVFIIIQRPISHGKKLNKRDVKQICVYSCLSIVLTLLWMEGLAICGPVRTILLSFHSDTAITIVLNLFFHRVDQIPNATRGIGFFGIGLFCLLLFDKDRPRNIHHKTEAPLAHVYHHSMDIFTWLGLPDHKGGMVLLVITSLLQVMLNNFGQKIAVNVNGPKRLKALLTCGEVLLLSPLFLASLFTQNEGLSLWSFPYEVIFIIFVLFILNFYVEGVSVTHLHKYLTYRIGTYVLFSSAVVIGLFWEHWYDIAFKHKISSGVIFATICFIAATRILVQPPPLSPPKGTLIGYSTSGEPLYSYAAQDGLPPRSLILKFRQYLRIVIESPESRSIFFYLCLNLLFTAVELMYGVWTNSLGLISDGFHMLFDCSALVLGLWAAIASKWPATKTFSFGYGRIEVLSGFVNGLFLVVIAFAVFLTAIQRIFDPPHVHTENLLTVSVLGLLVNLIGITAFSHAHSHGGKSCDGHSNSKDHKEHGHSHNHGHSHSHGHSHNKTEKKKGNANMEGVFLHVLADTLGSVGVIISTLLIKYYGMNIADPICSLFIAVMIIGSVIPLLKSSSFILLQRTPKEIEPLITDSLLKIKSLPSVLSCRQLHIWQHTSDTNNGCLVVQVGAEASEHKIRQLVLSILKENNISQVTVQVEKQSFYDHMSKITTGYYTEISFPQKPPPSMEGLLPYQTNGNYNVRIKDI